MKAKAQLGPDVAVKNVTLHSQGRREHGVLELFGHHVVFRYIPRVQPSVNGSNSHSRKSASLEQEPSVNEKQEPLEKSSEGGSKRRPMLEKKLHIAYPLINYCLLRPSSSSSSTVRQHDLNVATERLSGNDESLFPPTYGTSSSTRPSTDSSRFASNVASPRAPSPTNDVADAFTSPLSGRQPAIRMRTKDFKFMAFHFHHTAENRSPDESARDVFYKLRSHCCVTKIESLYAFHFDTPREELCYREDIAYDARREFARMGIGGKAAEGPGSAWRVTDINKDFSFSPTYPSVLCVPRAVSDNMLKYGGPFRSKSRIPALDYLHSNGGSITRSSQPMVGLSGKRNPQDERLVTAIFATQTPRPAREESPVVLPVNLTEAVPKDADSEESQRAVDSDTVDDEMSDDELVQPQRRIYGSTRQNYILDARPKVNALANKATGGGIEDINHYMSNNGTTVEKVFLNIANIHVMRASLDKVVDSMSNSDYLDLKPNQDVLRRSGWLGHVAGLLEGAELAARVVGLGGSHVLVHCSDGWDRTAQVAALAQVMLSPYCRTLEGFITLIQKDFISFGHKFRHRNGVECSEKWFEIENERIVPPMSQQGSSNDASAFNNFGAKAFSGAKSWFQNNRNSIFKQQNASRDSLAEDTASRPASPPPPNPLIHSPPEASEKRERKMDEKEVAPIFHQFLDAVYQLLRQNPEVFEFNERFLRRLYYQAYAGQYGEFLFNNEQERSKYAGKTTSVWSHFLARRSEMVNPSFVPKTADPLLFPTRIGYEKALEVRWWAELFGRKDEDMNLPRAEATTAVHGLHNESSLEAADDALVGLADRSDAHSEVREARSTPNLGIKKDSTAPELSTLVLTGNSTLDSGSEMRSRPALNSQETDLEVLAKYTEPNVRAHGDHETKKATKEPLGALDVEDLEPANIKKLAPSQKPVEGRLDFAAFATQNAFIDR
ncbi:phosphatases II [Polychaeton citri CBS 116435]|uniref:Phosphatases II n=1 Tax=Polychaeton citri CBS 116435 TaxID=1314669 RepID=A0A9P4Q7P8_9PEZI|nr:phosphatases II [Polychaeton citri CBS 116435]